MANPSHEGCMNAGGESHLEANSRMNPRKALKWLPVGMKKVGRPRTTWSKMAQKERGEKLGCKRWEEACEVANNRSEWKRLVETLCAT